MMKVIEFTPKDAMKYHHRKYNNFKRSLELFSIQNNELCPLIDMRWYETKSCMYCCVWVRGHDSSGSYRSGGYGYDFMSDCAYHALCNAGFTFDEGFAGAGGSAVREALLAIGKYMKKPNCVIVEAYG